MHYLTKALKIITSFIFLTLASCDNPQTEDKPKHDTPKALQNKSYSLDIVSKRSSDDLVDRLYKELVDKTPELKQLEDKIDDLRKSKDDSTELFDNYDEKISHILVLQTEMLNK